MITTGVLLHVYHLDTANWEALVWGDPATDTLGTGTKFLECLLTEPFDQPLTSVIFSGPSQRAGRSEGAYTKQFLLERFDRLREFPRLRGRLDALTSEERHCFRERLENLVVGEQIANTLAEVRQAARFFAAAGVERVIHIAAATHAPRCLRDEASVRAEGNIPAIQRWHVVASDTCHAGNSPQDVMIIERPHRPDDPQWGMEQSLPDVLQQFYRLPFGRRQQFIREASELMSRLSRE